MNKIFKFLMKTVFFVFFTFVFFGIISSIEGYITNGKFDEPSFNSGFNQFVVVVSFIISWIVTNKITNDFLSSKIVLVEGNCPQKH